MLESPYYSVLRGIPGIGKPSLFCIAWDSGNRKTLVILHCVGFREYESPRYPVLRGILGIGKPSLSCNAIPELDKSTLYQSTELIQKSQGLKAKDTKVWNYNFSPNSEDLTLTTFP